MQVWDAIQSKRAIREFRDEKLQAAHIERILNAGRRSQSSKNSQPWHFIAVQDKARLAQLAELGAGMGHVAGAALCIVIVVPTQNERTLWHFLRLGAERRLYAAGRHRAGHRLLPWAPSTSPMRPATCWASRPITKRAWSSHLAIPPNAARASRPLQAGGRRVYDDVTHWESW